MLVTITRIFILCGCVISRPQFLISMHIINKLSRSVLLCGNIMLFYWLLNLFYFFNYFFSRHRGTVTEVFEDTSIVSISLDDGKAKNFELGKQGIRFASQKQK